MIKGKKVCPETRAVDNHWSKCGKVLLRPLDFFFNLIHEIGNVLEMTRRVQVYGLVACLSLLSSCDAVSSVSGNCHHTEGSVAGSIPTFLCFLDVLTVPGLHAGPAITWVDLSAVYHLLPPLIGSSNNCHPKNRRMGHEEDRCLEDRCLSSPPCIQTILG